MLQEGQIFETFPDFLESYSEEMLQEGSIMIAAFQPCLQSGAERQQPRK